MEEKIEQFKQIIKIRAFEELILSLFAQNKLSGTTHTYIGEEATAVSLMKYVTEKDFIFSNHRCHGHYLAYGGPEKSLLAEIMSKESGLCQGKGGSQHIHYKNFFTNGVQGGIVPNATGVAFANKLQGLDSNTIVFLGDGTLGQGVVYESFNIAAINAIPIIYVIEDNAYAMSTKRIDVFAGDIKKRIEGFNIKAFEIESTDVDELDVFFNSVFNYINNTRMPVCAIVHNYRLGAHSKGDDTRDPDEIADHRQFDPIKIVEAKIGKDAVDYFYREYRESFDAIVMELEKDSSIEVEVPQPFKIELHESLLPKTEIRYVEGIRNAFERVLIKNERNIIFLGEDIRDPYGGAFKATKGLSSSFNKQIFNMPISEACMVGLSVGLAINNILPVTEIMFGDFISLGFDQLLNHASKYSWVYGKRIPMILRVPSGAKRGYGPTHSQSLEKFLIGIPCIRVLAMSSIIDPEAFYDALFNTVNEPTVIIENKKLYGQKTIKIENNNYRCFHVIENNHDGYSSVKLSIDSVAKPDCYIITYGGMVEDTLKAAEELMIKDEIQADVIVISQLSPIPLNGLSELIEASIPIFFVEEGTKTGGIGAEIIASLAEKQIGHSYHRISTPDMPIPNGLVLESQIIPDDKMIIDLVRKNL